MIEVGQDGLGQWVWTMISGTGRLLVWRDGFKTQIEAVADAKAYRSALWRIARPVDHRMGACL